MKTATPLVWFITGTSQGFGLELVRSALERGDKVVATSRYSKKVDTVFPGMSDRLLALKVDLHNPLQVEEAVAIAIATFGHIDVLINNAGHALLGAVEEASDAEILELFQLNVFALLRVTRAVLPHFRERRSGHIVNISSIAGLTAWSVGSGIYSATKFAVEGLSQVLAQEIAPLGIGLTIVEPGRFRTDVLGAALTISSKIINDYSTTSGVVRAKYKEIHGAQQGDPALAAAAIIEAVTSAYPPLHLLLGPDAYEAAMKQVDALNTEFKAWREVTCATDF